MLGKVSENVKRQFCNKCNRPSRPNTFKMLIMMYRLCFIVRILIFIDTKMSKESCISFVLEFYLFIME
jgi:hypothetical protein